MCIEFSCSQLRASAILLVRASKNFTVLWWKIDVNPDYVVVGDRMGTDVISGMESSMAAIRVLSGVSTRETLRIYAYRPSIVLDGMGDIPS